MFDQCKYILTTDRPLMWKISNGDISATCHPIHFVFGSGGGYHDGRIEWRYFRFDQIQDGGRPPLLNADLYPAVVRDREQII